MSKTWSDLHPIKSSFIRYGLGIVLLFAGMFSVLGIVLFIFVSISPVYFKLTFAIDPDKAPDFGTFFSGLVGTTFGAAGALLVAASFIYQTIQTRKASISQQFFKMIDYHRGNVSSISIKSYKDFRKRKYVPVVGRRAFVLFKLQLFDCLELVQELNGKAAKKLSPEEEIDLAYMVLYYGLDKEWEKFSGLHLSDFPSEMVAELEKARIRELKKSGKNIGRTNQTILSSYYRNMYNAIRLIDESPYFANEEKYDLVKAYRSQLSNSELAVFFFNVQSRFGKKWKKNISKRKIEKDHNLILQYQLFKNIPEGYLQNYSHKKSFDMEYEDDELKPSRY